MEQLKKINEHLRNYYLKNFENEESFKKVGWKDEFAQKIRFYQLVRSFVFEKNDKINDLGCGLGALLTFLNENYPELNLNYKGYDVLPEMITQAKEIHKDYADRFLLINNVKEIEIADYTFASGIFNLKYDLPDDEWLDYIKNTIVDMFEKSRKGIAFNCLTSYSDKEHQKPELYYTDPLLLFDFCKRNLSKEVALYHDYQQYDFTISVKK